MRWASRTVYKPLMIDAVLQSARSSGWLVTALSPLIGYDKASEAAHYAYEKDITLKAACLALGFVDEATFDRVVDPTKMLGPTG